MFYEYKKWIWIGIFVIWSLALFFGGMTFGSPQTTIITQEAEDTTKIKKENDEITVSSQTEGTITYTVKNVVYTTGNHIQFSVVVDKKTAYSYMLLIKDNQNNVIMPLKQIGYIKSTKSTTFDVLIPESSLESNVYVVLYPASKETLKNKKTTETMAYGKTIINIPEAKKKTIDNLK